MAVLLSEREPSCNLLEKYQVEIPSHWCLSRINTVWASGPKITQLESMINSYLRDVGIYLKKNSLLISAPKSTVTLFTPDKHQFQTHPDITLEDTQLRLERSPKTLGVIMDPSLSFHKDIQDRQEKQYAKGTGGIILGTGKGDFTADLQRIGEIYRKLCCTSLDTQR